MLRSTLIAGLLAAALALPTSSGAQTLDSVQLAISQAVGSDHSINVVPFEFDPNNSNLAKASWLSGTGCTPLDGIDLLCTGGDSKDKKNEGLLLVKTGLTANVVAAGARINGVKGLVITELGYDLRKPADSLDPRGSHCGAGAARFNVVINGATYFVGCNSPAPVQTPLGPGWIRLRWGGATAVPPGTLMAFGPNGLENISGRTVDSITLLFDEGQDTGPDNFGLAVLDNIKVNNQIAGRGPGSGS